MSLDRTTKLWKANFEKSGIKPELVAEYIEYIRILSKKGVPIIFDFNHLSLLLGKNKPYLASVVNSNISHYREFSISKRSGGKRQIRAPYPVLMHCQKWIYSNILTKVKIHPAAHGFTFNKSIISNSKIHIGQKEFLKIDLKDFFPSITINQVINLFKSLGYTNKVSFYLASICCYDKCLPQGAPTSPIISNIIGITLDKRLMAFAKHFNLRYTRYADDLAFSGQVIPVIFIQYISDIITSCGFVINEKKTLLQHSKHKRIITGISISDEVIKVPRNYKRALKKEIHFIRKYGIISHIRNQKIRNPDYLLSVIGKIHFWISVEPENEFAKKALKDLTKLES